MLDPAIIPALHRRIAAFAIDFGLVGLVTGLVARSQFQQFPITERTPGTNEPIWSADQFEALTQLSEGFNRKFERGNTLFVIDATGVLVTLLVGLVLAAILFVAIPAGTGWSPGKKLLGLRVIDADGATPAVPVFIARTIVGVIDLIPLVIPGLLGFALVARSNEGRRLGDRIAGTIVVDAKKPVRYVDPAVMQRRATMKADDLSSEVEEDESMVDLGDRLGIPAPPPEETADAVDPGDLTGPRAADLLEDIRNAAAPTVAAVEPERPAEKPTVETAASGTQGPLGPLDRSEEDLATGIRSTAKRYPQPAHRSTEATSQPATVNWEAPIAEQAPVWRPQEHLTQQNPAHEPPAHEPPADDRPAEAAVPEIPRSTKVQPAESEAPTATPADRQRAAEPRPSAAESVADPNGPIWNDQWQAWLYWDADGRHWLRHDPPTGTWIPIS